MKATFIPARPKRPVRRTEAVLAGEDSSRRVLDSPLKRSGVTTTLQKCSIFLYSVMGVFVLFSGCEQPFTPKGPYVQKLAVAGILSNTSDTQYVRVYKSYDPPGFDPYAVLEDQAIRGAAVTVSDGSSIVRYQESLIARTDSGRFTDKIVAYAANHFRLQPGGTYNLDVATPSDGSAHSTVTVPDTGWVTLLDPMMLSTSRVLDGTADDVVLQVCISSSTAGYMVRFYLEYDLLQNSVWVRTRTEIPGLVVIIDTARYYGYPKLLRRSSTPGAPHTLQREGAYFMVRAYAEKLKDLRKQFGNDMWIRRGVFVLTQAETNLYTFFNIANGYQDAISIRLDMPDWTNINGGIGVFGAMVEDTLYVDIPN